MVTEGDGSRRLVSGWLRKSLKSYRPRKIETREGGLLEGTSPV